MMVEITLNLYLDANKFKNIAAALLIAGVRWRNTAVYYYGKRKTQLCQHVNVLKRTRVRKFFEQQFLY